MFEVMFWPIVACVLLAWLLVYLGLHVVQRGIIFIDIAMAQMASLGIALAVLLRLDLQSPATFAIALGFTLLGAAVFSITGKRASEIPQEAVIGISYVVAVGVLHFVLRKNFLLVSFNRDAAYEKGLRVRWWDFLFYAAFGLVVTSFVASRAGCWSSVL